MHRNPRPRGVSAGDPHRVRFPVILPMPARPAAWLPTPKESP